MQRMLVVLGIVKGLENKGLCPEQDLKADFRLPIQVRLRRIPGVGPRPRRKAPVVKSIQTMLDVSVSNVSRPHVRAALLGLPVPSKGHDVVA